MVRQGKIRGLFFATWRLLVSLLQNAKTVNREIIPTFGLDIEIIRTKPVIRIRLPTSLFFVLLVCYSLDASAN